MLLLSDKRHIVATVRRTSLNLNLELVEQAKAELGARNTTDTIHRALEEVVRRAKLRRLAQWKLDEPPPDGYDNWNDWIEADTE
jgi:hypothetical protein